MREALREITFRDIAEAAIIAACVLAFVLAVIATEGRETCIFGF